MEQSVTMTAAPTRTFLQATCIRRRCGEMPRLGGESGSFLPQGGTAVDRLGQEIVYRRLGRRDKIW